MTARLSWFIAIVLTVVVSPAWAVLPGTFSIDQVYSNADGNLQFVVIYDAGTNDCDAHEDRWASQELVSTGPGPQKTFVFPTNLPTCRTSRRRMFIASEGFAALGLVTPDYIIPNGFLQIPSGAVEFAYLSIVSYNPIPTDGVNALYRNGTIGQNLATNFAGESATLAPPPPQAIVNVVEYHHLSFDHYFITSKPDEIAILDSKVPPFQEWSRTGLTFHAYVTEMAPAGSVPICRFFNDSAAFAPKSSHFYAPKGLGCEDTIASFPDWKLENDKLFSAMLPDGSGNCPAGTIPVYRLYNNGQGGAPNHRFTISKTVQQTMLAQGFVAEPAGIGVGMCVPE